VVLTNGDVDAVAGLLSLREGAALTIYAHEKVLAVLRENSVFNVLDPLLVKRQVIATETPFKLTLPDGTPSAIEIVAFDVPGKVPLYLESGSGGDFGTGGGTLGLHIRHHRNGAHFFYLAACAQVTPAIADRVRGAPLVFFDGTLWRDDEMIRAGLGSKTGGRMGHVSMAGEAGAIQEFRSLGVQRKVFLHVNNTNPAHTGSSDERAELERAGWEILRDGTEIVL
jgi:pyrroloquinoline quinone biosynthesis protein B